MPLPPGTRLGPHEIIEPSARAAWARSTARAPDGKVMALEVHAGAAFEAGTPQALFTTPFKDVPGPPCDASADGQRFLLNRPIDQESSPPITLVQNWKALLKR